jgi:carbon monoxide dehydrogenase subunit G
MRLEWHGTREMKVPVERVWATLLDPQAVARCAGATDPARVLGEHRYAVTTRIGILFVRLPITLEVEMLDLAPPHSGRMQVNGTGPGTGLVGASTVRLETLDGGHTRLHWSAETTVHGRLAEFGASLVEPLIRHTIEEFWNDFARSAR